MKFFLAILVAVLACIAIPVAQSQGLLNFNCPGTGRYPVEGDCNAYYVCTAKGGLGVQMLCLNPLRTYFDPATRKCAFPIPGTECSLEPEDSSED